MTPERFEILDDREGEFDAVEINVFGAWPCELDFGLVIRVHMSDGSLRVIIAALDIMTDVNVHSKLANEAVTLHGLDQKSLECGRAIFGLKL